MERSLEVGRKRSDLIKDMVDKSLQLFEVDDVVLSKGGLELFTVDTVVAIGQVHKNIVEVDYEVVVSHNLVENLFLRDLVQSKIRNVFEHLDGAVLSKASHGLKRTEASLVSELIEDSLLVERL